jgi:diacylglycerol kinase (ATP)
MRGIVIVNGYHRQLAVDSLDLRLTILNRKADLTTHATEFPGHARHIAARAAASGADVVVAVGGDGTVNEVINGVVGTQTAVAVLPNGTANDFAGQMRITEKNMLAVSELSACWTRRVDLIRVNNWYFVTVGGLGLPCETLERAEYLKHDTTLVGRLCRALGSGAYLLSLLSLCGTLSRPRGRVTVESERGCFTCDPLSLLVANQSRLGHSFTVAPKAINSDGRCDLFIIERSSRITQTIRAVGQTIGPLRHEPDNIIRLQSSHLVLSCEEPTRFFGDGEVRLEEHRFDIEVIPRALRVLVPPVPAVGIAYPSRHRTHRQIRPAHQSLRPVTVHRTKT